MVTSLCAVLLGGACNTGLEPLIRTDNPALRRDRLSWVSQNYTLIYEHINMLGRYSFAVPEEVARGELRPLRNPDDDL
nr:Tn3 family transposase [Citrobacter freundii]